MYLGPKATIFVTHWNAERQKQKKKQSAVSNIQSKGRAVQIAGFAPYTEHLIQAPGVTVIGKGKVKITLEKAMEAQGGSKGTVVLFL
jgi:hypothetical protein